MSTSRAVNQTDDLHPYPTGSRRRNGLAVVGFVLGLVALATLTNLGASLAFGVLSLGASIPALKLHRRPTGLAIAAMVLTGLAVVAAIAHAVGH